MTEQNVTKRLKQVAVEFNVATSTIVEFLNGKGIDIENKPTSRVTEEAYEVLLHKFQPDKLDKQKSNKLDLTPLIHKEEKHTDKPKAPETVAKPTAKEESIPVVVTTPEPPVKEAEEPRVETPEPIAEKPAPQEEKPKPEPVKPEPVKSEAPVAKEEAEEEQEETTGLKVIGKIDLDAIRSAGKKKFKKPEPQVQAPAAIKPEPEPVAEEPKAEKEEITPQPTPSPQPQATAKEETPAPKPVMEEKPIETEEVTPKTEKPVEKAAEEKSVTEEAIIEESPKETKTETTPPEEKMGLTIVGKIDLDQFKPKKKQPIASTTPSTEEGNKKKKRKRKRIPLDTNKVQEENKERRDNRPGQGQGQGQGQNQGQGTGQRPPQGAGGHPRGPREGGGGGRPGDNRFPPRRHEEKAPMDEKKIQEQIKNTLSRLTQKSPFGTSGHTKKHLKRRKKEQNRQRMAEAEASMPDEKILPVTEFITVNELANIMNVPVTAVITTCLNLGLMVSINQRLDAETITIVADEFGYEVEFKEAEMDEPTLEEIDDPFAMTDRPPIVAVMGHVDHGKTSLLDYIRSSNVIAGEAGGITQHIGAYEVTLENKKKITFLDTPGHEAFTAMRARGAKVTDIAIIVIAADDSVMPQTREAISHAQAAGVPIVFAFNKIDKEGANTARIREQLAEMNILVEEWGGKYQTQEISAKKGLNIDQLLEKVLLEAEILELKADPKKRAIGTVIEASMDKGKGIVATVLVEKGTLHIGDPVLAGSNFGKVKALFNERGGKVKSAGPATPVQILGFDGAPTAGDKFYVTESEGAGKDIANKRKQLLREQGIRARKHITLDEIGRRLAIGNFKELNLIIKGDVDGSVEALSDSLLRLSTEEIQVNTIFKGVGQISESDVLLASASDAIIIGFQVRPSMPARKLAEQEQIDIRLYSVIYDAIEEVKAAMEGMLTPTQEEKITGNVEIREVYKITKVGTVAGCYVLDGKIYRNSKIRLVRDGVVIYTGELDTLKRFKDDVKEVAAGYECGLTIKNFNDIKEGDIIEAFEQFEVARKL